MAPATTTIRMAIQAPDPLSRAGLADHVAHRPDLELVDPDRLIGGEIVVVVAPVLNIQVMGRLGPWPGPA